MTVKLRAVEAPCRRLTGDAKLLESQFLHDAAASVVTVEVPDADRLRAKPAERAASTNELTLDHSMLVFASKLEPDNEDLHRRIGGVNRLSVHRYDFAGAWQYDQAALSSDAMTRSSCW